MLAAVFLLYIGRLAQWQLLEGSTFEEEAVQSSATYLKLTGTRGEILDCNGNVLAGNRSVYNAIYSRLSGSNETRNAVVLEAVKLLENDRRDRNAEKRRHLRLTLERHGRRVHGIAHRAV